MEKRKYNEIDIENMDESYFNILSKDEINNIMKSYEDKSKQELNDMKELFKNMYDDSKDKCIDIEKDEKDNLEDIYKLNNKTFKNSITIMENLQNTLKLSEEFLKEKVTFSDELNPVVFIELINNLYENEYTYITTEKYEYQILNEDITTILHNEKYDLFNLNKLIDKILKKKNIINNEFYSSLEFYKEVTVKYEKLIENAYNTNEIDKYLLMIKTTIDIYNNNYKIMFSKDIKLNEIDKCLNHGYFFINRLRELLCTTAYKITKIDEDFQNTDIYKENVNVQKCRETMELIEYDKLNKSKKRGSLIYNFFENIKKIVSCLIPVYLKDSGIILYNIKTNLIKFYIYASNTFLIKTITKGIKKEIKKEFIMGYIGSKITGEKYDFDPLNKYNEYILPDDKILKSETVMFIQIIQILGIIFCSTLGTSKQFWNYSKIITDKLIEYINKIYKIKFINSGIDEIKKFFNVIYTTLGYCGELIIDTVYYEFVYSIFTFICGNLVKFISNPIEILKDLSVNFTKSTYSSILSLYSYLENKAKLNIDMVFNNKETNMLIENVINNGLISIKEIHEKNNGTSYYLGELNPFNIYAGTDITLVKNFQVPKVEIIGTVIGSIISNKTQEINKTNKIIIEEIKDKINEEIKDVDNENINVLKLSKDIDELSDEIANISILNTVDILSNLSEYIIKNPKFSDESIEINDYMDKLKKESIKLLKLNISNELYQNVYENVSENKQLDMLETKNDDNYFKRTEELLLILISLIIKLLKIIKTISIKEILSIITEKASIISKTFYSKITESIRNICIKTLNQPAKCYNNLSEITINIILEKINSFTEQSLKTVYSYCQGPKQFFKLLNKVYKFIIYISEIRFIIYGVKTKIPNLKILLKGSIPFSKYAIKKSKDVTKIVTKKYRQYKYGPKKYKEGQKPLSIENIQKIMDKTKKIRII